MAVAVSRGRRLVANSGGSSYGWWVATDGDQWPMTLVGDRGILVFL